MAARWGRWRALGLRTGLGALESEEEAAARLEEQRRARAARLSRARRWLEPSGPPERQLSRLAMEQMRSLRREAPEEWPVSRLARSFEVSPDVVARILRSRFSPSPRRALAQDSRVQAQRSSGGGGLPAPASPGLLPSRAGVAALLAPGPAQRKRDGGGGGAPPFASSPPPSPAEDEQPRRLRAVRKGREVVDEEGNLLYRIPPRS